MICTLGDLLLDVIVRAPRPLAPGADTPVETRLASGGQAANVASWVAALGGSARLVVKRADDETGRLARSLLEGRGVELAGPVVDGRTGVVVSFVGLDGERSMATDLSANEFIELGWNKLRAGRTLHCRLGGTSTGGDITPSEDNAKVILMILGRSAPQPPAPSGDTYPPGCFVGNRLPGN